MNKDIGNRLGHSRRADGSDNTQSRIQIARSGGGRGSYRQVDGDFHYLHIKDGRVDGTVLTLTSRDEGESGDAVKAFADADTGQTEGTVLAPAATNGETSLKQDVLEDAEIQNKNFVDSVIGCSSYVPGKVDVSSAGGGRGVYQQVDGDLPYACRTIHRSRSLPLLSTGHSMEQRIETSGMDAISSYGIPHSDYPSLDNCRGGGGTALNCLEQAVLDENMVAISWNACGMKDGVIQDVGDLLDEGPLWDVLMYQEGPYTQEVTHKVLESGHVWWNCQSGKSKRSVGILLNRRWKQDSFKTNFVTYSSAMAYLDLEAEGEQFRFITAHLPHSSNSEEEYDASLADLEEVTDAARLKKYSVIIGVDANAVLGSRWPTDSTDIIGPYGLGERNGRGQILAPWMHGMRLAAAASMFALSWHDLWTHKAWSTSVCRQIDFILTDVSQSKRARNVGIRHCLEGKSDHRASFIEFPRSAVGKPSRCRHRVQRGWKPRLDLDARASDYHQLLREGLKHHHSDIMDVNAVIVQAATQSGGSASSTKREHTPEVAELFAARRAEPDPGVRKHLSKDLWRALRRQRRQRQDADFVAIAERGQGMRSLQKAQANHSGAERIAQIRDSSGHEVTDSADIAEVFAAFYEELYKSDVDAKEGEDDLLEYGTPITAEEIWSALKRMKNNRTGAEDGLVSEMLRAGSDDLIKMVANYFTDILYGRMETPAEWKIARLSVIFKKGDPKEPRNYRPISIIPVMAKLFSIVLYARMRDLVDSQLTEEQFGFRRGRGCDDVVHILHMVIEKSLEWGEELWMATLDVEKAFDKVYHDELFEALLGGGVDVLIVSSLRKLYRGMQAYVQLWPGVDSRRLEVQRGVRQGDPLSPVLFNLVITQVLKEVDPIWQRRGYGTEVGRDPKGRRLTHVAFADDMTLMARSWTSLKRMVTSLREALRKRGLELHPSKCKAQTNSPESKERGSIQIMPDFSLNVVAEGECLEVLGTALSLQDATKCEVEHRIATGWRKFWAMKRLLLNVKVSRKRRLRLFDATVGSSVLYGSHAWTPRAGEISQLRTVQNRMIRRICGARKPPAEPWVEWIQRATHQARRLADEAGVRDWVHAHARRKWLWAGHVMRRPTSTWLWRVTSWRDHDWDRIADELGGQRLRRPSRRRWMKWEDPLWSYFSERPDQSWTKEALDKEQWNAKADAFAQCFSKPK